MFVECECFIVIIVEDLYFDVLCMFDEFFEIDVCMCEVCGVELYDGFECCVELCGIVV